MASMWFQIEFNLDSRWIHSGFPIRGPGPHLVLCESTLQISFHCGFKYSSTSIRGIHFGFPRGLDSFRISDPGARATFSTVWIHIECKYRFIVVSNTVQARLEGIHLGFPNTKYGFNVVSNRVQSRFEVDSFRISDPGARATFSTVWIHIECKYRFIVVSNTVQPRLGGFIWGSRVQNMASMWFQIEFIVVSNTDHSDSIRGGFIPDFRSGGQGHI